MAYALTSSPTLATIFCEVQRSKVMWCKNQLPFSFFRNNIQQFSQQILKHTVIKFIYCNCDRWMVVNYNQKLQNGHDFLNTLRLITECSFLFFRLRFLWMYMPMKQGQHVLLLQNSLSTSSLKLHRKKQKKCAEHTLNSPAPHSWGVNSKCFWTLKQLSFSVMSKSFRN